MFAIKSVRDRMVDEVAVLVVDRVTLSASLELALKAVSGSALPGCERRDGGNIVWKPACLSRISGRSLILSEETYIVKGLGLLSRRRSCRFGQLYWLIICTVAVRDEQSKLRSSEKLWAHAIRARLEGADHLFVLSSMLIDCEKRWKI